MNQWLRLILPAHQKQPTKQKPSNPCECCLGWYSEQEGWGWSSWHEWGCWPQQKVTAPGAFKMRNPTWPFLGPWKLILRVFRYFLNVFFFLLREGGTATATSRHVCAIFSSCSPVKASWPQLLAAINLLSFSPSLILSCLKLVAR